jgi:phosphohistidine swiveling domain-containing protein
VDTETLPDAIAVRIDVPPGHWRRAVSHCPRPLSPLFRAVLPGVTAGYRRMLSEIGILSDALEWREIGGWVYTQVVPPEGEEAVRRRVEESTKLVRSDRFADYLDRWHNEWRPQLVTAIEEHARVDLKVLNGQGLTDHLGSVLELAGHAVETHIFLHGIGGVTIGELAFVCRDLLGWDDVRALELLSGLSHATTAPAVALAGLAAMARQRPALRRLLEEGDEDAVSRLAETDPQFATALAAYHAEFGLRAIHYETMDPSIEEMLPVTLHLIRDQLRSGFDAATRAEQVTGDREAARAAARAILAGRSPADQDRFERVLARAERWYPVRDDDAPITISEPLALVRRAALEAGRRFVDAGVIDERDDVFFLEVAELLAGVTALIKGDVMDHRALVKRRRAERAWVEAHPGPPSYGADPGFPSVDDLPLEARLMNDAFAWLIERGGHFECVRFQRDLSTLTGVAASAGTYSGPVRVVLNDAQFDKLQPGDVLVCPMTSPAWAMLFPNVGALVTDAGGLVSHPAIIAREFHIPAVVGTGNATALLRDGQRVRVDGIAGSVELLA